MVGTRTTRRRRPDARGARRPGTEIPLPPQKAFVLQLSRDTGPGLQPFGGRLEHLSTGKRLRFDYLEEFLEGLARLLGEVTDDEGAPDD